MNRKSVRPLAKLFPYMKRYRMQMLFAAGFLLTATAATLSLPVAVRRVVDHGFSNSNPEFVNSYFAMLVGIAALLAISSACRYYFVVWLGERIVADIRREVFNNVTTLSADFFDTARSGEIVSRLSADTTQIKSVMGITASIALRNTLLGLGSLLMMFYTSPRLSLMVIGAIPFIVLPVVAFGRETRRRASHAQDTLAAATAYASEAIGAVQTMQAFANEKHVRKQFGHAVDDAFNAVRNAIRTRAFLTAIAIFLVFTSVVGVLWIGASDVLSGKMSGGTLGQFLLYAAFAAGSFGALSEVWGELSMAAGSAERLVELLDEKPAIITVTNPKALVLPIRGHICFDDVRFSYPARPEISALDGLSLKIGSGETVAVVGASGAGKSTLFSLLLRFYDPQSGAVCIDGMDIRDLDPEVFRQHMALVPQESVIFSGTVSENIAYGSPDSSHDAILAAARAANANEFISRLPNGFDSELGEKGITLSGGQRQRLAIARAILKDAPILLLDEATSALDAENERLVQEALEKLMEGRTTLIIAHRLATIQKAARILVLDDGRVVEEGTHASLKKRGGLYAGLAKLQFGEV